MTIQQPCNERLHNDYAMPMQLQSLSTFKKHLNTMLSSPNINASYTAGIHNWSHITAHHVIFDDPFQTVELHLALPHLQQWMKPLINFE